LIAVGDLGEARQHTGALLPLAESLKDQYWLITAYQINSSQHFLAGEWQLAREFSDRGLAIGPSDERLLSSRIQCEYELGDFEQGKLFLERLLDAWRQTPTEPTADYATPALVIPVVARITGVPERFDIAETVAQNIMSLPATSPIIEISARVSLALLAVLRGDSAAAKEHYFAIESRRVPMLGAVASISAYRVLGLLAQTFGDIQQAATHFEDALAFCRQAGYRPELAWTCCDYADTLLQRKEPGDREKAMSLLDESLAISSELGMRPLMERVLSRREILKA